MVAYESAALAQPDALGEDHILHRRRAGSMYRPLQPAIDVPGDLPVT
jgi:hypothetical protein